MRFNRLLLFLTAFSVAAALAGAYAAGAKALAFTDAPCYPNSANVHVCSTAFETGKPMQLLIGARAGCTPYATFSVTNGTALPPGLSIDTYSGLISGTPTTAGVFTFWLQLQDHAGTPSWCSDNEHSERQFQMTIVPGLTIVQRQAVLTPAIVNQAYNLQFTANNVNGATLTWSVASGSLPAGLTLDSKSGTLSGTPTALGDSNFQIKTTDGNRSDVQTYSLSVVNALKVTSPSTMAGELTVPFKAQLTAEGGRGPYTWALAQGSTLPEGLSFDATTPGLITGEATRAGTFAVSLTVTDSLGLTQTVNARVVIAKKLTISGRGLPTAHVGRAYHARVKVTGGIRPETFTIVHGKLPAGIRLSTHTGALTGRARGVGTSRVTIKAIDKLGVVSTANVTVKVSA